MNNIRTVAILAFLRLLLQCSFFSISGAAQEIAPATQSPEITLHSSSNLVLVDVIARNGEGDAVVIKFSGGAVDFRLAGAVSDGDGKPHATVGSSGIKLCKFCANYLRKPCFTRKSGAHSRT